MCTTKPVPADVVKTTKSQLACCNPQFEIYNLKFFAGVLAQLVERLNGIEYRSIALTFAHVLSPVFQR